jgi:hypothetical protein
VIAVVTVHLYGGEAFMGLNLILALWGWLVHRRRRRELPAAFWTWLRVSAGLLALEIVSGALLLLAGVRLRSWLHLLYAALIVLTVGAQEMLRPGGSMRRALTSGGTAFDEPYWYGLLALANAVFAMRQVMTGLLGF